MPTALHPEAKKIILRLTDFFSPHEVAYWLDLNPETVYRIRRHFNKTGSFVNEEKQALGRPTSLTWSKVIFIIRLSKHRPDMYLSEIQERLWSRYNIVTSLSTISRVLTRQGLLMKQLSKRAIERDEDKRTRFYAHMSQYKPEELVCIDECAVDKRITVRKYGRGLRGERVVKKANFVRGNRYSVLPALSFFGVFNVVVVKGSITGDIFEAFIADTLREMQPYPGPRSVLLMDNATIHRNEVIEEMAAERGVRLVYLPAYSPDFNPIEEGFSAFKAWIRRRGEFVRQSLNRKNTKFARRLLAEAVHEVMVWPKTVGWWEHSGYCRKADYDLPDELVSE